MHAGCWLTARHPTSQNIHQQGITRHAPVFVRAPTLGRPTAVTVDRRVTRWRRRFLGAIRAGPLAVADIISHVALTPAQETLVGSQPLCANCLRHFLLQPLVGLCLLPEGRRQTGPAQHGAVQTA